MIDQTAPIPVHITNVDTGEVVVKKMLISKFVERYSAIAEQYMKMGKYAVIGEFYDDLIWTFRVGTAATDGIRIYFNPIFVLLNSNQNNLLVHLRVSGNENSDNLKSAHIFHKISLIFVDSHDDISCS
jgi:hypothetical protein